MEAVGLGKVDQLETGHLHDELEMHIWLSFVGPKLKAGIKKKTKTEGKLLVINKVLVILGQ